MRTPILLLAACAAAAAQVYPGGGYPGQSSPYPGGQSPYPGGQSPYPGGRQPTGGGIPMPGGSKNKKDSKVAQPMPNFRGALKVFDQKSISLELGDKRVMDFKRNDKTKFFKAGDEVKTPNFAVGDQVSVEAMEEVGGYMTAVNVYWEKSGGGAPSKRDEGVVDTWKDEVKTGSEHTTPKAPATGNASDDGPPRLTRPGAAAPAATAEAREERAPAVRPDPNDPGPPRLKRGGVADPSRQKSGDVPEQDTAQRPAEIGGAPVKRSAANDGERVTDGSRPSVIRGDGDEDTVRSVPRKDEPLIRRAADTAMEFTETLPSYICQEMVTRSQSESTPANFQPIDVVSMEVLYTNGREEYKNIQINGKKSVKKIEETGGAWSTGEFGTVLVDLFSPATNAVFKFRRDSRAGGVMAKMYDFEVAREGSHWSIHSGAQSFNPPYQGAVWIDPATARVLRIEMEAKGFPGDFPLDHVESATDYQYIRLGDAKQYLLPVHAETLSCQRGTAFCSRNVIDFRNYHKYSGESSITFGGATTDKK
ncbi:MAG: hypothetical protein ABI806_01845 [Candidatus Solibacter sp.]